MRHRAEQRGPAHAPSGWLRDTFLTATLAVPAGTDSMSHPFMQTPGGVETVKTAVPGSYRALESVNAFCGVGLTFHDNPILGGDYPSKVMHSPWPQRFQSSWKTHFGVTNYKKQKGLFPLCLAPTTLTFAQLAGCWKGFNWHFGQRAGPSSYQGTFLWNGSREKTLFVLG